MRVVNRAKQESREGGNSYLRWSKRAVLLAMLASCPVASYISQDALAGRPNSGQRPVHATAGAGLSAPQTNPYVQNPNLPAPGIQASPSSSIGQIQRNPFYSSRPAPLLRTKSIQLTSGDSIANSRSRTSHAGNVQPESSGVDSGMATRTVQPIAIESLPQAFRQNTLSGQSGVVKDANAPQVLPSSRPALDLDPVPLIQLDNANAELRAATVVPDRLEKNQLGHESIVQSAEEIRLQENHHAESNSVPQNVPMIWEPQTTPIENAKPAVVAEAAETPEPVQFSFSDVGDSQPKSEWAQVTSPDQANEVVIEAEPFVPAPAATAEEPRVVNEVVAGKSIVPSRVSVQSPAETAKNPEPEASLPPVAKSGRATVVVEKLPGAKLLAVDAPVLLAPVVDLRSADDVASIPVRMTMDDQQPQKLTQKDPSPVVASKPVAAPVVVAPAKSHPAKSHPVDSESVVAAPVIVAPVAVAPVAVAPVAVAPATREASVSPVEPIAIEQRSQESSSEPQMESVVVTTPAVSTASPAASVSVREAKTSVPNSELVPTEVKAEAETRELKTRDVRVPVAVAALPIKISAEEAPLTTVSAAVTTKSQLPVKASQLPVKAASIPGKAGTRNTVSVHAKPVPASLASVKSTKKMVDAPVARTAASLESKLITLNLLKAEVRSLTIGGALKRVSVANEKVCQIFAGGKNSLKLIGVQEGTTRLTVSAEVGPEKVVRSQTFKIVVGHAAEAAQDGAAVETELLTEAVNRSFPGSQVLVNRQDDQLLISGTCVSEEAAKQIVRMVRKSCLMPVVDNLEVR